MQNRASVSCAGRARGRTQITRVSLVVRGRGQPGALSPRRTGGLSMCGDRRAGVCHRGMTARSVLLAGARFVAWSFMSGPASAMAA